MLAVAVLKAVRIGPFGHSTRDSLVGVHLDANVVSGLESNAVKLDGLDVPQIKMQNARERIQIGMHQPSFSIFAS